MRDRTPSVALNPDGVDATQIGSASTERSSRADERARTRRADQREPGQDASLLPSPALGRGIAAVHAAAPVAAATEWGRIVELYDRLLVAEPSPVVELNRAVAVAIRDGPAAGLQLVDDLFARGLLINNHLAHAARADLLRRLGRVDGARAAYARALELARTGPERRFLSRRLAE